MLGAVMPFADQRQYVAVTRRGAQNAEQGRVDLVQLAVLFRIPALRRQELRQHVAVEEGLVAPMDQRFRTVGHDQRYVIGHQRHFGWQGGHIGFRVRRF